jgi:hypothetical protein
MPTKDQAVGTDVDVTVSGVIPGNTYTLQYETVWPPGAWANVPGAISVLCVADPMILSDNNGLAGDRQFYRVWDDACGAPSTNECGAFRIDVCLGTGIFGMPLQPSSEDIHDTIGWQMNGTMSQATADQVSTWDGAAYVTSWLMDGSGFPTFDGTWRDAGGGGLSTDTIAWGEGFWLTARNAAETVWVEGLIEPSGGSFTVAIPPNPGDQILVGHPWPMDDPMNVASLDNLNYQASGGTGGMNITEGDTFYMYPCGGTYDSKFLTPLGFDNWYEGSEMVLSTEVLNPREGWWIRRGTNAVGGFIWTYPAPY